MARDIKWVIDTNNVLFNTHEFHIHTELKRFVFYNVVLFYLDEEPVPVI